MTIGHGQHEGIDCGSRGVGGAGDSKGGGGTGTTVLEKQ